MCNPLITDPVDRICMETTVSQILIVSRCLSDDRLQLIFHAVNKVVNRELFTLLVNFVLFAKSTQSAS